MILYIQPWASAIKSNRRDNEIFQVNFIGIPNVNKVKNVQTF